MATYDASAVADSVIAHQKGISLQQGRALRDNPLAIAEGATGAPYMQTIWHPYDSAAVGDGNDGTFYDHATDGTVSDVESPTFADMHEYAFIFEGISCSTIADLQIEGFRSYNSSWGAPVNLISAASGPSTYSGGPLWLSRPFATGRRFVFSMAAPIIDDANSSTYFDSLNVTLASSSSDMIISKVRFSWSSGNIDAGKIKMLKRKVYA